ncbi:unnamed protein product [Polarella glacialis]|uniref:NUC153 domain-containing protein n=1 Tax=Polarella glacialis TaxID=89957 RepID=A0A813JKF8_POLGL|nr:unnamed protein product [Polarella glacialis]
MDARFDTSRDPRFKRAPRNVRKVEVDGRFAHMFHDKRFVEGASVDKRGEKIRKDASKTKMKEFYELAGAEYSVSSTAQTSDKKKSEKKKEMRTAAGKLKAKARVDEEEEDEAEAEEAFNAQEEAEEEDEDDEEEEESEESADDADDPDSAAVWEKHEENVPRGDATLRLAVMGCDWDHVSASDLMVMFRTYLASKESRKSSGLLGGGSVVKVSIYPSDYGLQQLEREAREGPLLIKESESNLDDEAEAEKKQTEALRKYQMERTKYSWSLVECDSLGTSSWLYDQLDGLEADGICPNIMDLRFVPDETVSPHKASSECTDVPAKFSGPGMMRSALGHTKVKCTWDEAPPQRRKDLMRKKFTPKEIAEMDLSTYLASDSDDEEEAAGDGGADALRALVGGSDSDNFPEPDDFDDESSDEDIGKKGEKGKKKEEVMGDMEATFNVKAMQLEEELADRAKQQGEKHTLEGAEAKSTWEKYLDKRKEKRKQKKVDQKDKRDKAKGIEADEEGGKGKGKGKAKKEKRDRKTFGEAAADADLELLADEGDDEDRGFNLRGPQRRAHEGKRPSKHAAPGEDGDFKVDVDDPRISKVFNSADFEIDPNMPQFRKTEGMGEVLKKKRQRKLAAQEAAPTLPAPAPPKPIGGGGLQLFASAGKKASPIERNGSEQAAEASASAPGPAAGGKKL